MMSATFKQDSKLSQILSPPHWKMCPFFLFLAQQLDPTWQSHWHLKSSSSVECMYKVPLHTTRFKPRTFCGPKVQKGPY
jgi:hypothetical protein